MNVRMKKTGPNTLYYLLLGLYCVLKLDAVRFVQDPSDIIVVEGHRVFFYCIVEDLREGQDVSWMRSDLKVSSGHEIINPFLNYAVAVDSHVGQYRLMIESVSRDDSLYLYSCSVFYENDLIVSTETASLTVLEVPAKYYPVCSHTQTSYPLGGTVIIICKSEQTSPPADLCLMRNNEVIEESQYSVNDDQTLAQLEYRFRSQMSDIGAVFTCALLSPLVSVARNCTTPPLQIHYQPIVTVQGSVVIQADREPIFICNGDSQPPVHTYTWNFDPHVNATRFTIESGQIMRILQTGPDLNGVELYCIAANVVGTSTKRLVLEFHEIILPSSAVPSSRPSPFTDILLNDNKPNQYDSGSIRAKHWYDTFSSIIILTFMSLVLVICLALLPLCCLKFCCRTAQTVPTCNNSVKLQDVYSEPKDRVIPPPPSSAHIALWKRSVGVPVNEGLATDPIYVEIPSDRYIYSTEVITML